MSDSYAHFAQCVLGQERQIAAILGNKITAYVRSCYGVRYPDLEDKLEAFFAEVAAITGQNLTEKKPSKRKPSTSNVYKYKLLLKSWRDATKTYEKDGKTLNRGGANLSVATYYYLYTIKSGQTIVEEIDNKIFRKRFAEKFPNEHKSIFKSSEDNTSIKLSDGSKKLDIRHDSIESIALCAAHTSVSNTIKRLVTGFGGRKNQLSEIDNFVSDRKNGKNSGLLLITAPAGYGKSSLLAQWCQNQDDNDERFVARHFCKDDLNLSTDIKEAIEYLNSQISFFYDEKSNPEKPLGQIIQMLRRNSLTNQLIVCLEGVDEAMEYFKCFLPEELGLGVCVIISARAGDNETPPYLEPFTVNPISKVYNASHMKLENFSIEDVKDILKVRLPSEIRLSDDEFGKIREYILKFSYNVMPAFTSIMISELIEKISDGEEFNIEPNVYDIISYTKNSIYKLEKSKHWNNWRDFISLIAVLEEPMTSSFCNKVLEVEFDIYSIPIDIRRWLHIEYDRASARQSKISFTHPSIRVAFKAAMTDYVCEAEKKLCNYLIGFAEIESFTYSIMRLTSHFVSRNDLDNAINFLQLKFVIDTRCAVLEPENDIKLLCHDMAQIQIRNELNKTLGAEYIDYNKLFSEITLAHIKKICESYDYTKELFEMVDKYFGYYTINIRQSVIGSLEAAMRDDSF